MKFNIERQTFIDSISRLIPIAAQSKTLPILSTVLLKCDGSSLTADVSDLESWMRADIDHAYWECSAIGALCVDAKRLYDICKGITGEVVDFETQGSRLKISSGASSFLVNFSDSADFPVRPEVQPDMVVSLSRDALCTAIDRTIFATSKDDSRFNLNGALFEISDNSLRMVATDGHRLSYLDNLVDVFADDNKFLLPRRGLSALKKFIDRGPASVTLEVGKKDIRVSTDSGYIGVRLIDGDYPDYRKVIPDSTPSSSIRINRDAFKRSCEMMRLMTSDRNRGVTISARGNSLIFEVSHPDLGSAENIIELEDSVSELTIIVNVDYLMDAVSVLASDEIRLSYFKEGAPVLFHEINGSNDYFNLVMPMRK